MAALQAGPAVLMCRDVGVGRRETNTTEASEDLVAWSAFCVALSKQETFRYSQHFRHGGSTLCYPWNHTEDSHIVFIDVNGINTAHLR